MWNSKKYKLRETSNAKSELVFLFWTPRLCLRFVLYDMRLITFIIAMYGVMHNSLYTKFLCKTECIISTRSK